MNNKEVKDRNLLEQIKTYLSNRLNLFKIEAIELVSKIITGIITAIIVIFLGLLSLIFLGIGLSVYLSSVIGSGAHVGYFITAVIFILLIILVLAVRKAVLEIPLMNFQIKQFFNNEKKGQDNE